MRLTPLCFPAFALFPALCLAQGVPVIELPHQDGAVHFKVKASVPIEGTFSKWEASMKFASTDIDTGVFDIKIWADSVNTGSGMKNDKLKSADFFDAKNNPYITFHSTKFEQTGPATVTLTGTFTIRGVSKPETLIFGGNAAEKGTGTGTVTGTMAFDRKEYGMNSGIPFIKIADRVEVSLTLKAKRVSGPPIAFKQ